MVFVDHLRIGKQAARSRALSEAEQKRGVKSNTKTKLWNGGPYTDFYREQN